MSFFEPQTEPPPIYRSGRLQEEQRLVAKPCSFFWRILCVECPNFAELELSKETKSYYENPCNRITGKKTSSSIPQRKRLDVRSLGWGKKTKKDPSPGFSPTRGRAKGRSKGQRAMAVEKGTSPIIFRRKLQLTLRRILQAFRVL